MSSGDGSEEQLRQRMDRVLGETRESERWRKKGRETREARADSHRPYMSRKLLSGKHREEFDEFGWRDLPL